MIERAETQLTPPNCVAVGSSARPDSCLIERSNAVCVLWSKIDWPAMRF